MAIDRNRIHTAPSIYWRIIIATAKARATGVAGDASGGRGGHRGVEWLPADCQDRNSTTRLQNPIPRDRGSSKSQTLLDVSQIVRLPLPGLATEYPAGNGEIINHSHAEQGQAINSAVA